jgi:hypothetical protein
VTAIITHHERNSKRHYFPALLFTFVCTNTADVQAFRYYHDWIEEVERAVDGLHYQAASRLYTNAFSHDSKDGEDLCTAARVEALLDLPCDRSDNANITVINTIGEVVYSSAINTIGYNKFN